MFNQFKPSELNFLQQGYSKVSMFIASQKYQQAQIIMNNLIQTLESMKPNTADKTHQQKYNQTLSQCYVNLSTCLFSKPDGDEAFNRIQEILNKAIDLDNLNYWAYFNLASYLYRTYEFKESLNNLKCSLSCLLLMKAVLSKDIQNRSKQIDLGRSIGYCQNNLQARFIRLLIQIKQMRWKMALNEIDLILQIQKNGGQLQELKKILLSISSNNKIIQVGQLNALMNHSIAIINQLSNKKNRLQSNQKQDLQKDAILKEIDEKTYEFNELFKLVNDHGSAHNLFSYKVVHRTNKFDKKIHMLANILQKTITEEPSLTQSAPYSTPNSVELQARVIERMNQSKRSYGESLFQITKSQNLQNSKNLIMGSLLSQVTNTQRALKILPSQIEQNENESQQDINIRKKVEIEAIQSLIQPLNQIDQLSQVKVTQIQEDDLLLDSLYDKRYEQYEKDKRGFSKKFSEVKQDKSQEPSCPSNIYPLTEAHKVFQLILLKAEFRETLKQKFVGIYAHLEYNSGLIETYKFRSRQVNNSNGENQVQWGESLGFIKIADEPKNMLVKVYKSEPYYYNDKFLGEGEIQVTVLGIIKIPLYSNTRNVGSISIKLILSEQSQNNSFKKSNFSSSLKSQSQSSQTN